MAKTRAARAAAARAAAQLIIELPADVLGLVLYQLRLAHDIALAGFTCRAFCEAAKLALKLRPFSANVKTLASHKDIIYSVAPAADGRIVTAAHNCRVKVWKPNSRGAFRCVRTIQAHTSVLRSLAVLPGGTRFVSGAQDRTAQLWSIDGTLERIFLAGDMVTCVAALPDGVHFAVGLGVDNKGQVRLYHVDGTLVHTFKGHTDDVNSVAVTPDGHHIISGADDKLVKVWSVATKSLVSTCAGHTAFVGAVAAMPDGQRFLSGGFDDTVRVWLLNGTHQNTFRHTSIVKALVALPDNQHALSGSPDKTVKLFNVNDGAVLRTFKHHAEPVVSLALLPDGLRFVSGSDYHTACIVEHGLAPFVA